MKRGTTPTIPITLHCPLSLIDTVTFLFKRTKNELDKALLEKILNGSEGTEDTEGNSLFQLDLTEADTRKLPHGTVFMDTKIVTVDGKIPATEIVQLDVAETLFGGEAG